MCCPDGRFALRRFASHSVASLIKKGSVRAAGGSAYGGSHLAKLGAIGAMDAKGLYQT
jgi:hypothetical protein